MTSRIRTKVRGRETRAQQGPPRLGVPTGFTLVEMLVAMAITLVMMGAVVTLFANISHSVRNRRATIEMTSQIRHVRNVLQQDLQGATCPGVTWQQSESNHGYIELIEGIFREGNASNLVDGDPITQPPNPPTIPPTPLNPEIDHMTSILPSSNLPFKDARWATDGGGLGDYDDILMLTVRNEHEPFVGRIPRLPVGPNPPNFSGWEYEAIHSTLAEVVWFAIENPGYTDNYITDPTANRFFGEPGMRTIYRRALLIAPWVNPYKATDADGDGIVQAQGFNFKVVPGLVRMLPDNDFKQADLDKVMAAVVAFQDRYDLSVRAEWDPDIQHWKIVANTLGDLTKRENRFGHFGFFKGTGANSFSRFFPYPMVSFGSGYSGSKQRVEFVDDPEMGAPASKAQADALVQSNLVVSYSMRPNGNGSGYNARPFAYVDDTPTGSPATAATVQAMLNDKGEIVRLVHGPVPLSGTRRGEDVMMTDVLAFDMRVYDPGAPMFATRKSYNSQKGLELDVVMTPTDPGWLIAYTHPDNTASSVLSEIGKNTNQANVATVTYPYVGQGAYVDMGYGFDPRRISNPSLPAPKYATDFSTSSPSWFFAPRGLTDVFGNLLAPGYAVYDTWSFHYENNGVNEDNDELELKSNILQWQIDDSNGQGTPQIDEGTNGLDDHGHYFNSATGKTDLTVIRLGVDDVGERETTPPYDKPLRGMQVLIRTYERDARAMRQVRVNQHFMQE